MSQLDDASRSRARGEQGPNQSIRLAQRGQAERHGAKPGTFFVEFVPTLTFPGGTESKRLDAA